jgi:hypothetical protein
VTARKRTPPSGPMLAPAPPPLPLPGDHAAPASRPLSAARADHAPGAPTGLPWQATPIGRRVRTEQGLYQRGRSDPALRPDTPEGEDDAFDAPRLPYMLIRRPKEKT